MFQMLILFTSMSPEYKEKENHETTVNFGHVFLTRYALEVDFEYTY